MARDAASEVVAVVGMHRAGTSVVARGLQALGLDLGDALMSADVRQNARGFFEDTDIVALDDVLLGLAGADWKNVAILDAVQWNDAAFASTREDARRALVRKVAPTGRFAFKDPRIARLIPFWRGVFAELGLADSYVVAVRHPKAVIDSLTARDGLDPRRSALLWVTHFLCAMRYTKGRPRLVVDYDRMLEAPGRELARIAGALGIAQDAQGGIASFERDFVSLELRHAAYAADDLSALPFPELLEPAHELAQRLARDEMDAGSDAAAAAVDAQFRTLTSLAPVLAYAGTVERSADELPRRQAELAWTRESLDAAIRYNEDLLASVRVKEAELHELNEQTAKMLSTSTQYSKDLLANLQRIEGELRSVHVVLERLRANPVGRVLLHRAKRKP